MRRPNKPNFQQLIRSLPGGNSVKKYVNGIVPMKIENCENVRTEGYRDFGFFAIDW